jgi:hypothetical protein
MLTKNSIAQEVRGTHRYGRLFRQAGACRGVPGNPKGYTLYVVLLILAVGVVLFTVSIAGIRSVRLFAKREVQMRQAKLLAESGIIRTEYFLNGGDGHSFGWETPGYEETIDSIGKITIAVERFGLYARVRSTGKRLSCERTIQTLFGRSVPEPLMPSLTLTGHVGGLILHNGSRVEGQIVLHHGSVYSKKNGAPLPDYARRLTQRESPPLPFDSLQLPMLFAKWQQRMETFGKAEGGIPGPLILDGQKDTLVKELPLHVKGDCVLRNIRIDGAVIAVDGTCTVGMNASVNNTAVYAKRIVVESGVTGASFFYSDSTIVIAGGNHNSQFCAIDSIAVRAGVVFGPMNVLAGYRRIRKVEGRGEAGGGIFLDDNATVGGTIICCSATGADRSTMAPSITFGKKSVVKGAIVTDGDCYMYECTILGRLWARSIVARDAGMSYTNYLIASTISTDAEEHRFPLLGELPMRIVCQQARQLP